MTMTHHPATFTFSAICAVLTLVAYVVQHVH